MGKWKIRVSLSRDADPNEGTTSHLHGVRASLPASDAVLLSVPVNPKETLAGLEAQERRLPLPPSLPPSLPLISFHVLWLCSWPLGKRRALQRRCRKKN